MHGSTEVEEMRAVVGMGGSMDAIRTCKKEREEEERGRGITVYTKILYAVVILQLGAKQYHT